MTTIPDPLAALIVYLNADLNVQALTAGRVFAGSIPRDEVANMERACVVLAPAGGGLMGQANDFGDVRVDTYCYGTDEWEAWTVYLAVRTALKNLERKTLDGVLLHWARPSSGGATGIDPETSWPLCIASFQVLAAELAAA